MIFFGDKIVVTGYYFFLCDMLFVFSLIYEIDFGTGLLKIKVVSLESKFSLDLVDTFE